MDPKVRQTARLHIAALILVCLTISPNTGADSTQAVSARAEFVRAWQAAGRGDRNTFEQIMPSLVDYSLYPYLRYEDLNTRRATVPSEEMAEFLSGHEDWAFTAGLRTAWLRSLGRRREWSDLMTYAANSKDTRVRCYLARAHIANGGHEGLLNEVQSLWAAGQSQPDQCDPAFDWLRQQGGITPGLAWMRIRLAVEARNPRMIRYLSRFLPADQKKWAEYWQQQDRGGYLRLDKALKWPDAPQGRDIALHGLSKLARSKPDHAANIFSKLDAHFSWREEERAVILRELALWSAVEFSPRTSGRIQSVPETYRDGRLLEWWARYGLATSDWDSVILAVEQMPQELRSDGRWRYWHARARIHVGDQEQGNRLLEELSGEATYYGFLAADRLRRPYVICPHSPSFAPDAIEKYRLQSGLDRALELRQAGLQSWARREWDRVAGRLDLQGLRLAAALAVREGWHERAIFALGNSGDLSWYEWRFPLHHRDLVERLASPVDIDPAWVLGLMRSESAMAEDAISSAGARGLMQVMPDTAKRLARQHGLSYRGKEQLLLAPDNIRFGTLYLQSLLAEFGDNLVLATGAYNAGPTPVRRWLANLPLDDTAAWIEILSYFETRDYIPRVLAFATIYDWRMQQPVRRITSRMPRLDSSSMISPETTEIVCPAS